MNENIDIAIQKNNGLFDISFANGDIVGTESFDTAIDMTIFEERRADESEQPVNFLRRGWWGNELSDVEGYEIGSKLWQAYQRRSNPDTANKIPTDLQEAFLWMVEDDHLDNVLVNSTLAFSNIDILVSLIRSNNVVDSRSFPLWENTGL